MKLVNRLVVQVIVVLGLLGTAANASAQSWTNQSKMKVARVEATTVDYRDNIYVFNGFKVAIKIANSVEKYNVATKQWSIVSTTSTDNGSAVTHNGVVRVGADVWLIGGRIGSHPGRVSDLVWIYNLDTNEWRSGPKLPIPGAAGGAALVNNKIHWIGGLDPNASCDVATHLVYDLGSPAAGWQNITATAGMPSPRNHFSTAVVNGIIYVMGGQYGHDACPGFFTHDTPLVHAFNPADNTWSRKANMPSKNSHSEPGTFVYKGDIYTTGGEHAGTLVWKYSPSADKWSTFRTLPESLVAPVARIIDGRLIVAGGGAPNAHNATDSVRSILVDNNPPTPTPQPEPEPGSHTPEGSTLISMEAEYFDDSSTTSTHNWVHLARGNSSNDDALITTPDQGELAVTVDDTPMLSYIVYFNYPGKHYIWVRGSGDTNDAGNSDSIFVGLNGAVGNSAYRIEQFPDGWNWSRNTRSGSVASLNVVNAGVNVVNFWMREDGFAIDKFVVTSDPNFVPSGFGPEVTDGSEGYVPPASVDDSDVNSTNNAPEVVEPTNDDPVVVEPTSDDPVVVEPTIDVPVVAEPISDNPVVVEPAIIDNPAESDPANDTPVTTDATSETNDSSRGFFGGSASTIALLVLFSLGLLRVGRCQGLRYFKRTTALA